MLRCFERAEFRPCGFDKKTGTNKSNNTAWGGTRRPQRRGRARRFTQIKLFVQFAPSLRFDRTSLSQRLIIIQRARRRRFSVDSFWKHFECFLINLAEKCTTKEAQTTSWLHGMSSNTFITSQLISSVSGPIKTFQESVFNSCFCSQKTSFSDDSPLLIYCLLKKTLILYIIVLFCFVCLPPSCFF